MNKYLRGIASILPALAIASASFAVHAQGTPPQASSSPDVAPLPFIQMGIIDQELNAARVFDGSMSSHNLDGLRRHNLKVLATVVVPRDQQACLVMASVVARHHHAEGEFRMTSPLTNVATDVNKGEAIEVACERAASKAVSLLFPMKETPDDLLKNAASKLDPRQPALEVGKRRTKTVHISDLGTLSEKGRDVVVLTLGDRWTTVVDHTIMTALSVLMTGQTESGKQVCATMLGMTPRSPKGSGVLIPDQLKFYTSITPKGQDCTYENLTASMKILRDNMADFYPDTSKLAEKGVKYPSRAQFKKTLAEYDAKVEKEAKAAAAKAAKEAKAAKPSSKVVSVKCFTECINGLCKRVFEDGRKDTVRIQGWYNFNTKMIEYDTSNICLL